MQKGTDPILFRTEFSTAERNRSMHKRTSISKTDIIINELSLFMQNGTNYADRNRLSAIDPISKELYFNPIKTFISFF